MPAITLLFIVLICEISAIIIPSKYREDHGQVRGGHGSRIWRHGRTRIQGSAGRIKTLISARRLNTATVFFWQAVTNMVEDEVDIGLAVEIRNGHFSWDEADRYGGLGVPCKEKRWPSSHVTHSRGDKVGEEPAHATAFELAEVNISIR